jgi:hypothetical protein
MSRAKDLIKMLEEVEPNELLPFSFPTAPEINLPFTTNTTKQKLEGRLAFLGIEGILVDDVDVDQEGHIFVTFANMADEEMTVVFMHSPEEGSCVLIGDESDLDDENAILIDLSPMQPPLVDTPYGPYINFATVDWLSKALFETILSAGELLEKEPDEQMFKQKDAFGNRIIARAPLEELEKDDELEAIVESVKDGDEVICEIYKTVIRSGKRVRIPVVRRLRKKRLTSKQRAGMRKAIRSRRAHKSQIARKRKRSIMARKRMHLGKSKLPKSRFGYKLGG